MQKIFNIKGINEYLDVHDVYVEDLYSTVTGCGHPSLRREACEQTDDSPRCVGKSAAHES